MSSEDHPPSEDWASGGVLGITPDPPVSDVVRRTKSFVKFVPYRVGGVTGGMVLREISRPYAWGPVVNLKFFCAGAHHERNVWGFNKIVHTQKGYGYD
jgi:hypothetical protein